MTYIAPSVGPTGLTIPSYNDIIGLFVAGYQSIYGANSYLGNDSAPYQLMAMIALAAADGNAALQDVYNNFSPAYATGPGLDFIVAINGLARKAATNSTCTVTLTGTAGAVITNGVIQNAVTGDLWNLPASVAIGGGGTVVAIATAQQAGVVNATASQLTVIATPTSGWTGVTNGSNVPALGQPVETDSQLRQRQAVSTELPSETTLDGTIAAIAATAGVTRYYVEENFTGSTDANGCPAHSITAVVEGGNTLAVATAIYNNRGLGVLTNGDVSGSPVSGTQSVAVTDPNTGITINIGFIQPPTYVTINFIVNAHPIAGGILSAAQIAAIQAAITAYIASLQIGEEINFGEVVAAASSVNANPAQPTILIRTPLFFGTASTPSTSTDVPLLFYEAAQTGTITVNSV
jgi:uncharacterized phage protein gp47/JayE